MVWCGVVWCIFIKWFIFIIYLINMKNRSYLEFGGYFLIKGIKWELIIIKRELSRELGSQKRFHVHNSFWEKNQEKSQEGRS